MLSLGLINNKKVQDPRNISKWVLINDYDDEFKAALEKYKCAKRYHETNKIECRQQCELFISQLEQRLTSNEFFMGSKPSLIDYAILPFIR